MRMAQLLSCRHSVLPRMHPTPQTRRSLPTWCQRPHLFAGADEATQVSYAISAAHTWPRFEHMRLDTQMRNSDAELRQAQHDIGYGKWPTVTGATHADCSTQRVRLPTRLFPAVVATPDAITAARAEVFAASRDAGAMTAAIVCATNALADEHNLACLDMLPGSSRTYAAHDQVNSNGAPTAGFNSAHITQQMAAVFDEPGKAPAQLTLKVNAPVHIMLTVDRTAGLVKGALADVVELRKRVVSVRLRSDGRVWQLCRMTAVLEPARIPFRINRNQIPLRLAWASTAHRIQGDDLDKVIVDLRHPLFAHGQLEVCVSRAHTREQTRFLVDAADMHGHEFETNNVVIPGLLT